MKAYIILGLAVVATILFIAAVASPFAVHSIGDYTQTATIWHYCTSGHSKSECHSFTLDLVGCSRAWSLFQTARAFGVLAILACSVFTVVAAVCAFKPAFALLPTAKQALIGFGVATAIAGIIYFSIDFSLFFSKFCDVPSLSSRGLKIGPSPVLAVVGWILAVIALIMSFIGGGAVISTSVAEVEENSRPGVYNAV